MAIYNVGSGESTAGMTIATISSNVNSISLTLSQTTADFTITYDGDGELTVTSSDTSVATVALVSGKTYRVTAPNNALGNAVITIKASIGATTIPANKVEISVDVDTVDPTKFNNMDWSQISEIGQAGMASNYWSVGDKKAITLNGSIGNYLTLSNTILYVYIIGFNHNSSTGIDFGCFKSILVEDIDVLLLDSKYGSTATPYDSDYMFSMNKSESNSGGWKACKMRYNILGSTNTSNANATSTTATNPVSNTLMAALPSDLRAVMRPMTIYTDNTGDSTDVASYVTATVDYLPLLAEWELHGGRTFANSAEKNYQKQYQYYKNGNSKVKRAYTITEQPTTDTSGSYRYWLRSPGCHGYTARFCIYDTSAGNWWANYSYGIAPIFRV